MAADNRKTRYTKMVLKDSLLDLMKRFRITEISIKTLCETADINRTTFYTHYKDIYDLLHEIESETFEYLGERLEEVSDKGDKKAVLKMVQNLMDYVYENHKSIQVLLSDHGSEAFQKHLLMYLFKMKDEEKGGTIEDSMRDYNMVFMVDGCIGLIQRWMRDGMQIPPSAIAQNIFEISYLLRDNGFIMI